MPRQPRNYVQKLMQYNKKQGTWITPKVGSKRYYEVVGQPLPKSRPSKPQTQPKPVVPAQPKNVRGFVYKQKNVYDY